MDTRTDEELARSHNLTTLTKNATTHCEINCIRAVSAKASSEEACKETLANCTVYVTVEPCIMCAYALNLAGVQRVVFGCNNDKFGGNGSILSLNKY